MKIPTDTRRGVVLLVGVSICFLLPIESGAPSFQPIGSTLSGSSAEQQEFDSNICLAQDWHHHHGFLCNLDDCISWATRGTHLFVEPGDGASDRGSSPPLS